MLPVDYNISPLGDS